MPVRFFLLLCSLTLLCASCASTGSPTTTDGTSEPVETSETEKPEWAEKHIGDVRVFYFVKAGARGASGVENNENQKEVRITLINRTHSLYRGMSDNKLAKEEYYLTNADTHDLLVILRDKTAFFDSGVSSNIGNRDPIKRAMADEKVDRIIAVERIVDGKADCSYLSRPREQYVVNPTEIERNRYKRFNEAQEWVLRYSRWALPRGTSGDGFGGDDFNKGRR